MEKRKEKGERRRIPEQEREMDRAIEKQEDWDEDRESGREVDRGVTKSKEGGREKKGGQREVDRAEEEEGESATQMLNTNRWGQSWTSVESKGLEGKLSQEVGGAVWGRRLVRIFFLSFKKKQQGPCSEEKNTLCNGQAVIITFFWCCVYLFLHVSNKRVNCWRTYKSSCWKTTTVSWFLLIIFEVAGENTCQNNTPKTTTSLEIPWGWIVLQLATVY